MTDVTGWRQTSIAIETRFALSSLAAELQLDGDLLLDEAAQRVIAFGCNFVRLRGAIAADNGGCVPPQPLFQFSTGAAIIGVLHLHLPVGAVPVPPPIAARC